MAARQNALGLTGAMQGSIFAPLQQAQSMIGGPTVLGSSAGSSYGSALSQGYGGSQGQSSNTMEAWSRGSGSGKSGGIGVGGK
jgi:hypothetical protein